MKAEYRDAWVAALRSGEYKQGLCYLNRNSSYCCLGVLADLAIKNNWFPELNMSWQRHRNINNEEGYCYLLYVINSGMYGSLSTYFTDTINLTFNFQDDLITLNDTERYSFEQIADYIEANLQETQ